MDATFEGKWSEIQKLEVINKELEIFNAFYELKEIEKRTEREKCKHLNVNT